MVEEPEESIVIKKSIAEILVGLALDTKKFPSDVAADILGVSVEKLPDLFPPGEAKSRLKHLAGLDLAKVLNYLKTNDWKLISEAANCWAEFCKCRGDELISIVVPLYKESVYQGHMISMLVDSVSYCDSTDRDQLREIWK